MAAPLDLASFRRSLDAEVPPVGASAALRGCWHALRGEWEAAHDAVQPDDDDCAWVHAVLHREEGDHTNAGYWYRLAGRRAAVGAVRDEYLSIAAELLQR